MRTAVYLRVSTNRQTQAQTIEQQWERLKAHLHLQGEQLLAENVFRDDGYSGASLTRPGLDRLRDRVKSATLDRVLLTSPDRLARNYVHQMVLIEEWERSGCRVEFLDRPMSQDPHDQLLLQIRGAVAEYERVLIAERMRRGRQMKLQAGVLLPWTIPPYGYRSAPDRPRDPSGVQIEPAEGAIVQELFTLYLADKGTLLSLAKYLLHLDLPSPRGNRRWSTASLRGVLTNPAYTGKLYIGRSRSRPARIRRSATHPLGNPTHGQDATPVEEWILVGTVPALVSQEDFDRVQAKLALNKKQAARNNKSHRYLLRALVSCGACQSACIARTTNGGIKYYVCRCKAQPIYSQHDQRWRMFTSEERNKHRVLRDGAGQIFAFVSSSNGCKRLIAVAPQTGRRNSNGESSLWSGNWSERWQRTSDCGSNWKKRCGPTNEVLRLFPRGLPKANPSHQDANPVQRTDSALRDRFPSGWTSKFTCRCPGAANTVTARSS
jgi:site-specific DNA recombinase